MEASAASLTCVISKGSSTPTAAHYICTFRRTRKPRIKRDLQCVPCPGPNIQPVCLITTTGSKISCTRATTLISSCGVIRAFRHLWRGTLKKTFPRMVAHQLAQGRTPLASSYQPAVDKRCHHCSSGDPARKSASSGVRQVSCSSARPPCGPRRSGRPLRCFHLQQEILGGHWAHIHFFFFTCFHVVLFPRSIEMPLMRSLDFWRTFLTK